MDVFVEYMVKRKKTAMDYIKVLGILVTGLLIVFILPMFAAWIPMIGSLLFVVVALVVYLMYKLVTSINVEYEYTLTNSEMDVDKIINLRSRKKVTEVNFHKIECFANIRNAAFNNYSKDFNIKKIYACRDSRDDETYFVVYENDDKRTMLLFTPNEKMCKNIKMLNPQKCMID